MKHEIAHELSEDVARKVADKAFDSYSQKYSQYRPILRWINSKEAEASFSVKGISLKGNIELRARAIVFDLDVPFLFRPFRNTAIKVIERELEHWVSKAKNGEIT